MPELIAGLDRLVTDWVIERVPEADADSFWPCVAIGVASGDRLIAGVLFHDWRPQFGVIELSMAADSPIWARRSIIKTLLAYPFDQLGANKLFTVAPSENTAALKVNRHIGFTQEAILAHHLGPKRHAVINRMLRADYSRLYGDVDGQEVHTFSA
jgi:RimJ/RimL family protein N-acetyltransferase